MVICVTFLYNGVTHRLTSVKSKLIPSRGGRGEAVAIDVQISGRWVVLRDRNEVMIFYSMVG